MNVGGEAWASLGPAADNQNYIEGKSKGDAFIADGPIDVGNSTWGRAWTTSRSTLAKALTFNIPT